jgi:hypothetical protein
MPNPPPPSVGDSLALGMSLYGVAAVIFFIYLLTDWISDKDRRYRDGALFLVTIALMVLAAAVWPLSLFDIAVGKFAEEFCCNEVNTCCGIQCCGLCPKKKKNDDTLPGDVEMTLDVPMLKHKRTEAYASPGSMAV